MKKFLKIFLSILIFIISFLCVDGLCARFLGTRPIVSKRSVVIQGSANIKSGYVYKSLFADVYYCDTIYESYDEDNNSKIEEIVTRHYQKKDSEFVCPMWINEKSEIRKPYREEAINYRNMEYMKINTEGLYKSNDSYFGSYNKKLNVFTVNYLGDYYVDSEYQDIYMFDVDDFSKDPIKLEIDGFDMLWRTYGNVHYSPSGNIMVFEYFCGYRSEQWMGEQKYTQADCEKNEDESGIYVFRVNGINDYNLLGYFSKDRNKYVSEYKESYFHIYDVIDDENIIFKYTVTHNKQEAPLLEVYYKWNIVNDTLMEWQV